MNKSELKAKLTELYNQSLLTEYSDDIHPVRIVESIKSIISIDFEEINIRLIHWLENLISNIDIKSEDEIKPIPTDKIVSFHNLKFALKEKKIVKAREEMGKLVLVSDGKQILEYLLELSMLQTGQSFLFIWSALRSYNFFGNENYLRLFNLCLDSINSDKFARENGHVNFFHHAITKQIKHDKLVRNIFIEPNLYKFELKEDIIISQSRSNDYLLSEIVDNLKNNQEVVLEQITDLANQEDRIWLSDLLKQIEVSDYSPEMIMLFDSMRILLRFSQNKIWAGNQFGFKLMSEMKHVE